MSVLFALSVACGIVMSLAHWMLFMSPHKIVVQAPDDVQPSGKAKTGFGDGLLHDFLHEFTDSERDALPKLPRALVQDHGAVLSKGTCWKCEPNVVPKGFGLYLRFPVFDKRPSGSCGKAQEWYKVEKLNTSGNTLEYFTLGASCSRFDGEGEGMLGSSGSVYSLTPWFVTHLTREFSGMYQFHPSEFSCSLDGMKESLASEWIHEQKVAKKSEKTDDEQGWTWSYIPWSNRNHRSPTLCPLDNVHLMTKAVSFWAIAWTEPFNACFSAVHVLFGTLTVFFAWKFISAPPDSEEEARWQLRLFDLGVLGCFLVPLPMLSTLITDPLTQGYLLPVNAGLAWGGQLGKFGVVAGAWLFNGLVLGKIPGGRTPLRVFIGLTTGMQLAGLSCGSLGNFMAVTEWGLAAIIPFTPVVGSILLATWYLCKVCMEPDEVQIETTARFKQVCLKSLFWVPLAIFSVTFTISPCLNTDMRVFDCVIVSYLIIGVVYFATKEVREKVYIQTENYEDMKKTTSGE